MSYNLPPKTSEHKTGVRTIGSVEVVKLPSLKTDLILGWSFSLKIVLT